MQTCRPARCRQRPTRQADIRSAILPLTLSEADGTMLQAVHQHSTKVHLVQDLLMQSYIPSVLSPQFLTEVQALLNQSYAPSAMPTSLRQKRRRSECNLTPHPFITLYSLTSFIRSRSTSKTVHRFGLCFHGYHDRSSSSRCSSSSTLCRRLTSILCCHPCSNTQPSRCFCRNRTPPSSLRPSSPSHWRAPRRPLCSR